MLTGVVATDAFKETMMDLQEQEKTALPAVLQWLHDNNPWFAAYRAAWQSVEDLVKFCRTMEEEGGLVPNIPEELRSTTDKRLKDCLHEEQVAVLQLDSLLKEHVGTTAHWQLKAEYISRCCLREALPEQWRAVYTDVLEDESGQKREMPEAHRAVLSFAKVSFMDPFVDAKTFVLQYPYGTGSHIKSSLWDCIEEAPTYRQQCLILLEVVFTPLDVKLFWTLLGTSRKLRTLQL